MAGFSTVIADTWHSSFIMKVYATDLAPARGVVRLPSILGTCVFEPISNNFSKFGLPQTHPLQRRYKDLVIQYWALVVQRQYLVERGGIQGLALRVDCSASTGLSAGVHSWDGRNALAPIDWSGGPNSDTDPAAQPKLEQRNVGGHEWQSYLLQGLGDGHDQIDGMPTSLDTMYIPGQGLVRQLVLVPDGVHGLSIARQTMNPDEVTGLLSILLFDPTDEGIGLHNSTYSIPRPPGYIPDRQGLGGGIRPQFSAAAGGMIQQSFTRDIYRGNRNFWRKEPSVLVMVIPIDENQAQALF